MAVLPARIIQRKREGHELTPDEFRTFLQGYLDSEVSEYQMAAFLMAVLFRGLSSQELSTLLEMMIGSGAVLDLSHLSGPAVDKHSTGGVGDKTSLVLAPLAASRGAFIPMMSGRGLGHTTGTLDKLEAIPGFRTRISLAEFGKILETIGFAMMGQTEEIAPLDRRLYSLRDATATVPSIPLIAASIMSKKLAEGITGLVLDVKTGTGAFISDGEESRELAETMVALGGGRGVRTTALLTDMDAPLGRAIGNGLETVEALHCLAGQGPEDLRYLSLVLAGEMLHAAGLVTSLREGFENAQEALDSGEGLEKMAQLVEAQGGDPRVVEDPERLPTAPEKVVVHATAEGFVAQVDPLVLGYGVVELGGGRRKMDDQVDPRVGFVLDVTPGRRVEPGSRLGTVHAATPGELEQGKRILLKAVTLTEEEPPSRGPLVRERIAGDL